VTEFSPEPVWSPQQQAWLQAMGYTVYLEGGALDAPLVAAAPVRDVVASFAEVDSPAPPKPAPAPAPVRRAPVSNAPEAPVTTATVAAPARRAGGLRMPDRLQIALLRASGLNPNEPQTRALMDSWPLSELRADPAAKRALWPQLRALRKRSQ
jgi:hypothetical protein